LLVIFDARTKGVYAHSVPRKGLTAGACKLIVDDLDRLGYTKIVLKSDAEPSLVVFNEALARAWPGEVIPEHSRKGDSQSNGEVERSIQTLTSQVRAMKIALSENIGADILDDAPVVSWMSEYAAFLLRRHLVGPDGRTAYERCKGRGDRNRLIEFGEVVLYKPPERHS
jgi:hypothetical protein